MGTDAGGGIDGGTADASKSTPDASTGVPDSSSGVDAAKDANGDSPATPPPGDGGLIPAGYPTPTAATYADCQTVAMSGGICPGGGAGPVCIECLFGGSTYTTPNVATAQGIAEAGNYLVTVDLGGVTAGQTFISAEANRGLLSPFATAAGHSQEFAFVVNVRALEGQPQESTGSAGYPGLDMFFSGPTATPPQVSAIGYALITAATKPVMVYIASDSTACDQTDPAYAGWGQMLPEFFSPPVGIANYADSGESSASFMGASKWGAGGITSHWTPGDYVLIQFGTNDKGVTDAAVQANLESYVTQAIAAKVTPILISPPARVQFVGNVEGDQSSLHAASAQAAALAENVAYIDLTALSTAWYNSLGSQAAALKFHANDSDATHTNFAGATMLASIITNAMKTQNLPLAQYLR
jgi:lysophospholipase L1-like esterase